MSQGSHQSALVVKENLTSSHIFLLKIVILINKSFAHGNNVVLR
jgi:hypothetical protein